MTYIKLDKKALDDLEDIFKVIALDKPMAANAYIEKLRNYIKLLSITPEMGKECRKSGFKRDCRVLYYKNYAILYKINKTHISIKRVLNSKQNYKG
jgi:plasmid stabilization system protein ParE